MIDVFIPIHLRSEANDRSHWTAKSRRHSQQKFVVSHALLQQNTNNILPCFVKLIKEGGNKMDDDNVVAAFKYVRDAVADVLIPGKKAGQADSDPRIKWLYEQKAAKLRGIRIQIWSVPSLDP